MHHNQQEETYSIAGLPLKLVFPEGLNCKNFLPSFEPFLVKHIEGQEHVCSVEISFCPAPMQDVGGKLRSDVSLIDGVRFKFYEQEDCYLTTITTEENGVRWKMKSNKDFSQSVIHILNEEQLTFNGLSWLIMVAFGQTCLLHRTILIHASVVACGNKGYAFLGKSGTGKSTHSRLWIEHIEGAQLLNDDNPAIRLEDDGLIYVYGTPWSGKTACYKSLKFPIKAFVRLEQAPKNQLSRKKGIDALVCILPSCTAIRWNKDLFTNMTNTVEAIVQKVLVTKLQCLPNEEAARLCYREIMELTNLQTREVHS